MESYCISVRWENHIRKKWHEKGNWIYVVQSHQDETKKLQLDGKAKDDIVKELEDQKLARAPANKDCRWLHLSVTEAETPQSRNLQAWEERMQTRETYGILYVCIPSEGTVPWDSNLPLITVSFRTWKREIFTRSMRKSCSNIFCCLSLSTSPFTFFLKNFQAIRHAW